MSAIDVRAIDADGIAKNGDQAFIFHGGSEFLGASGELIDRIVDGTHALLGDINGDTLADFAVSLPGLHESLAALDIML